MRFGTIVLVTRGGSTAAAGTPGCHRVVRGILIGSLGCNRVVRLLEDDPLDTTGWAKVGDVGHWSKSAVVPAIESKT